MPGIPHTYTSTADVFRRTLKHEVSRVHLRYSRSGRCALILVLTQYADAVSTEVPRCVAGGAVVYVRFKQFVQVCWLNYYCAE